MWDFTPIQPVRLVELRMISGLNQKDFWQQFGVTQSGGSRYEGGRGMPKPLCALINFVYEMELKRKRREVRRA